MFVWVGLGWMWMVGFLAALMAWANGVMEFGMGALLA